MASIKQINEALANIFIMMDKAEKTPVRGPVPTPDWAAAKKAEEAVPKAIEESQSVERLNIRPLTEEALTGGPEGINPLSKLLPPWAQQVRTRPTEGRGPGPAPLTAASGTKFEPLKKSFRAKQFLKSLEEEMDELSRSSQVPADELEAVATKNVQADIDAGRPKRKFKTVQERRKVQEGRKAAIRRGEQKYIPRGNPEDFGEPPLAFGESEFGIPGEITDLIDEATGPISKVRKQKQIKEEKASLDFEESMEQMDDLVASKETKQIGEIQDELDADKLLRTLSPELQKEVTRDILIPNIKRLERIDDAAATLFGKRTKEGVVGSRKTGQIPEIKTALSGKDITADDWTIETTPRVLGRSERTQAELIQGGASGKQFNEFNILVSKVAEAAREANKIRPNMDKVHEVISEMPESIKAQLRPAAKDGTLNEALTDMIERLSRRMETPAPGQHPSTLEGPLREIPQEPIMKMILQDILEGK